MKKKKSNALFLLSLVPVVAWVILMCVAILVIQQKGSSQHITSSYSLYIQIIKILSLIFLSSVIANIIIIGKLIISTSITLLNKCLLMALLFLCNAFIFPSLMSMNRNNDFDNEISNRIEVVQKSKSKLFAVYFSFGGILLFLFYVAFMLKNN